MSVEIMAKIKAIFTEAKNRMQVTDEPVTALPVEVIQKPKTFKHREHVIFVTDDKSATLPYSHPADGQYNFSNYLTGIQAQPNTWNFFTSLFSDGSRGQHPQPVPSDAKDVMINPQHSEVKKIQVHHNVNVVVGIRLTDKDNKTILEVGYF